VILSPEQYASTSTRELLCAAALGQVPIDHAFLRALADRGDSIFDDFMRFITEDREKDRLDIAEELLTIARSMRSPAALPFLIELARQNAADFPDGLMEAFIELGEHAVEPLLALRREVDDPYDVTFALAALRVRDPRVLPVLLDYVETDPLDAAIALGSHGDPAARPAIEEALRKAEDPTLQNELRAALAAIEHPAPPEEIEQVDLWSEFPEKGVPAFPVLPDNESAELLSSPEPRWRAGAVSALATADFTEALRSRIVDLARHDPDTSVRAAAWEALENETDQD
jgi:HEAT repeat protein